MPQTGLPPSAAMVRQERAAADILWLWLTVSLRSTILGRNPEEVLGDDTQFYLQG